MFGRNLFGSAFCIFLQAPVFPRSARGALWSGTHWRGELFRPLPADRTAAVDTIPGRDLHRRIPGQRGQETTSTSWSRRCPSRFPCSASSPLVSATSWKEGRQRAGRV